MIKENRIQNRYKKVVTRTKRYVVYVYPNTVMVVLPLRVWALLASWTHGIRNIKILFTAYSALVAKCLWYVTEKHLAATCMN
jgi:hypothetical protein